MANTYNPNLARTLGAAQSDAGFIDIRAAVEPGIQSFKQTMNMRQIEKEKDEAQRKREDELKFNLYANLPGLEEDLIPEKFKSIATQKALELRDQQKYLINNKENMDQYEFIDQMRKLDSQVGNLNKTFNDYKQWSANWVDLKDSNDLSSGMSANDREKILDVLQANGEPVMTEEGIGIKLQNGEIQLLSNLPKVIPMAHDKHRDISSATLNIAETLGLKGVGSDNPVYQNRMKRVMSDFKASMSTDDALSLGADFLKLGGELGEYAGVVQDIIENPELIEETQFDDRDEFGKVLGPIKGMEGYKEFIADQYALIAKTTNDSLKKQYDDTILAKSQVAGQKGGPTYAQLEKARKENAEYMGRINMTVSDLNKMDFSKELNTNQVSEIAGGKVVEMGPKEEGNPHPGEKTIIINDNIVIPASMTEAQKIRKILEAKVANGSLKQTDLPNLLMSIKATADTPSKMPTATDLLAKYSTQNK